jgi:hypothetical protein
MAEALLAARADALPATVAPDRPEHPPVIEERALRGTATVRT